MSTFAFLIHLSPLRRALWLTQDRKPSVHADTFFLLTSPHPELYTFLPFGPYPNAASFVSDLILFRIQRDPGMILFVVLDKTRSSQVPESNLSKTFAGVIGLLNSSVQNLSTEIGFVITFPAFQRTHVTSNACGLLLHYTLDPPDQGGLGLRRVQWQANVLNQASVGAAKKLGFKWEGVLRWDRVLPPGKVGNGKQERDGEVKSGYPGRDTALLSFCWDDWETERENVRKIMDRR